MDLYNQSGEVIGDVKLPDKIFDVAMNAGVVKQAVDAQLANSRQVTAHAKDRSEVRGGGRKPWRQKGTGRARHASIRSPIWRHGGATFGPTKERNFEKKINKKTKRRALFMALSSKVKDRELMVLDVLNFETPKTKIAAGVLKTLSTKLDGYKENKRKKDKIVLVTPDQNRDAVRAINNLPFAVLMPANSLNVRDILAKKYIILLKDAVSVIEKTYKL